MTNPAIRLVRSAVTALAAIPIPRHPITIWFLSLLVIVGYPAVSFIYWPQVLEAGMLPPHGDSIAIPMFDSIFGALFLSPFVLLITFLSIRGYSRDARLFTWQRSHPVRSWVLTLLLGAPAALTLFATAVDLGRVFPWYEYTWTVYFVILSIWALILRAAALSRQTPQSGTETKLPAGS